MSALWTDHFLPGLEPRWLDDFAREPTVALDALLRGAYDLGVDNAEDADETLLRWTLEIGLEESFAATLDEALSIWLSEPPSEDLPALRRGFGAACRLLFQLPEFTRAHAQLRHQMFSPAILLDRMAVDGASYLLDDALTALTVSQRDAALAGQWWSLVRLDGDVPLRRGRIGVMGIADMPDDSAGSIGGAREDLLAAVLAHGRALLDRVEATTVSRQSAKEYFSDALAVALLKNPFHEAWASGIGAADVPEQLRAWASEQLPTPSAFAATARIDGTKTEFAVTAAHTHRDAQDLRTRAQTLLKAGDTTEALQLSSRARELDPWSVYSWTIFERCVFSVRGAEHAVPVAWEAVERFPDNVFCWQELGYFLKESDRFDLAEEVWYETLERFPQNEPARNSLAALLLQRGRVDEAGHLLAVLMSEDPSSDTTATWIEFLRRSSRLDEAESAARQEIESGRATAVVCGRLIATLRDAGRPEEAREALEQASQRFPADGPYLLAKLEGPSSAPDSPDQSLQRPVAPAREASVLRRRLRRLSETGIDVEAQRLELESFIEENLRSPTQSVVQRSLLDVDAGEVERAICTVEQGLREIGRSTDLLYVRARAARTQAKAKRLGYTTENYRQLLEPFTELRERAVSTRTLRDLGAVRAAHALSDGQPLAQLKFDTLLRLDSSTKTFAKQLDGAEGDFHKWFRGNLKRLIAEELDQVSVEDADRALTRNARKLDGLEEDFMRRLRPSLVGR